MHLPQSTECLIPYIPCGCYEVCCRSGPVPCTVTSSSITYTLRRSPASSSIYAGLSLGALTSSDHSWTLSVGVLVPFVTYILAPVFCRGSDLF